MDKQYWVYILASRRNGTLYTGVTNELGRRVFEHKCGLVKGFTRKHSVNLLVWSETFSDIREAIATEKRIKRWRRSWKIELIEKSNPCWDDLYETLNH